MKIKNIGIVAILFLASGCNDVAVKPYEMVLNKTPSQVDMAGYTMVDQDGEATDKPIKAKDRFSQYLYAPSEYVGKALKEEKDADLVIFGTLDGKIAFSIVNVSVNEMKTVQDVLKSKYGPAQATRAGVRSSRFRVKSRLLQSVQSRSRVRTEPLPYGLLRNLRQCR